MDINFHYFTTKVLAKAVGYAEADAQTISTYCQLVNDFSSEKIELKDGIQVPESVKHLIFTADGGQYFYGIATHYQSLAVEQLQQERYQRQRMIPFHFPMEQAMPKKFYKAESDVRRNEYRTRPVSLKTPTIYWTEINSIDAEAGKQTLIYMGILCHILGDSYGNQKFSGTNGWENCAYLWDAVDNVDQKNVTKTYPTLDISVGHKYLGNAPDASFLSYTMKQRSDPAEKQKTSYQNHFSRYNAREFTKAAKIIYGFLSEKSPEGQAAASSFETLEPKLLKCYLNHGGNFDEIKSAWSKEFPGETFSYDAYALSNLGTGNDEGFFHFNYIADIIRKKADPFFEYPFSE